MIVVNEFSLFDFYSTSFFLRWLFVLFFFFSLSDSTCFVLPPKHLVFGDMVVSPDVYLAPKCWHG